MMMRKWVLVLVFLWLGIAQVAQAQSDEFLERFSVQLTESNVLLNWTTRSGNTCFGIDILRSTDNINFEEVGRIPGICGSPGESQAFTFTDLAPVVNQTNYYKLYLGSVGLTSARAIEVVDAGQRGYIIKPHPVTDQSKLYFENETNENCVLTAYSVQGLPTFSQETRESYFLIDAEAHFPGLYFFTIQDGAGKRLVQGKVLVQRN